MAPDTFTHVSEPSSTTPRMPSDGLPTEAVVLREMVTPRGKRASKNTWDERGIEASTRADITVKSSSVGVVVAVSSAKPPRSAHGNAASFLGDGGASSEGGSSAGLGATRAGGGAGGGGADGGSAGADPEAAGADPEGMGPVPEGAVGTDTDGDGGAVDGPLRSSWASARRA
jgi:hypothetical protein